MKQVTKILSVGALACSLLLTSCGMNNTGKGALFGAGGGAALGAVAGYLIGGGKGAAIGAGAGAAVGGGAGAIIGHKMDKQAEQLRAIENAKVSETTDANGLKAIRVTFDGGILFATNSANLSQAARTDLTAFAASLKQNPETNVQVFGFTDNTGTMKVNEQVSTARANSVEKFLEENGVAATRITAVGCPMTEYIASNETAEGRAQNRRVEIYISANENMIKQAEAEAAGK